MDLEAVQITLWPRDAEGDKATAVHRQVVFQAVIDRDTMKIAGKNVLFGRWGAVTDQAREIFEVLPDGTLDWGDYSEDDTPRRLTSESNIRDAVYNLGWPVQIEINDEDPSYEVRAISTLVDIAKS